MSDEEFFQFCAENRDLRIERRSDGTITLLPFGGAEMGCPSSELTCQLREWAKRDGRGRSFGANTGFFLPNGAMYAPDASWVPNGRIATLSKRQKQQFMPLCPDFVVELASAPAKMCEWMANGAALGWLIDADRQTVYIYRPEQEPAELTGIDHVDGEGPVAGFRPELNDIWAGL